MQKKPEVDVELARSILKKSKQIYFYSFIENFKRLELVLFYIRRYRINSFLLITDGYITLSFHYAAIRASWIC